MSTTKTARLPADLKGIRIAVMALSDIDKLLLRQTLTDMVRLTNADTNQTLHGDARWRIGQVVMFGRAGRPTLGVLLGGADTEVTVWPLHEERFATRLLKWEDILAVAGSPRIPCERIGEHVVVTERGRAKAEFYADARDDPAPVERQRAGKTVN